MGLRSKIKRRLRPVIKDLAFRFGHLFPRPYLNLGGGPNFAAFKWDNLDGARGERNPDPYQFHAECALPYQDGSKSVVYSSHFLEHVDPATARRVLAEARRILKPSGTLVLKLPDFDKVIEKWREGDKAYFGYPNTGMDDIVPSWASHGVPDTVDYRATQVFCGYWNNAWGDHFSREIKISNGDLVAKRLLSSSTGTFGGP